MTDKSQKILQKMQKRQALKRLNNPETRDRILDEFNREQMGDVGPLRGIQQGTKLLSQMNSLGDDHDQYVKSLMPGVNAS